MAPQKGAPWCSPRYLLRAALYLIVGAWPSADPCGQCRRGHACTAARPLIGACRPRRFGHSQEKDMDARELSILLPYLGTFQARVLLHFWPLHRSNGWLRERAGASGCGATRACGPSHKRRTGIACPWSGLGGSCMHVDCRQLLPPGPPPRLSFWGGQSGRASLLLPRGLAAPSVAARGDSTPPSETRGARPLTRRVSPCQCRICYRDVRPEV